MTQAPLMTRLAQGAAFSLMAALASVAPARAADFPTRPVTVITPFAPGSGPDAVLRMLTDKLSKQWGQPLLVDNRTGGGGFIAIDAAKRASPDGYTLLQLDSEHLAALPYLYKARNFFPLQHFDPVAPLLSTHFLIAVPATSKWQKVSDLVEAAKSPAGISYGSWGVGSPGHLGAQQLEQLTGTRMQHIPFREVSQLYVSVSSAEVSWAFATLASSQGTFKSGRLRYLAVAAPKRLPQMPDVPTVAESGGPPSLDLNGFLVLVAPKGLPPSVSAKLTADIAKALTDPEIRARYDTFAFEQLSWSPEEIRQQVAARARLYDDLVRRGNISLD